MTTGQPWDPSPLDGGRTPQPAGHDSGPLPGWQPLPPPAPEAQTPRPPVVTPPPEAPPASPAIPPVAPQPLASSTTAPVWDAPQPPHAPAAPPARSGGQFAWIAAIAGAVVLLAGGGWFALTALGSSGGAESPEAAMDQMIEAINNEDFLSMAELLEPGERRAIAEPMLFDVMPELQRIGVLADDFDSGQVDGFDFEFTDVTYEVVRPVDSPDVALITMTGGTSTSTVDLGAFRFGDALRDEVAELDPEEVVETETASLASDEAIVMVERDGRWYFSPIYTALEEAFPGELPALGMGLRPLGAESPETAVESMINEMVDLDLDQAMRRLDPNEMHALHRYAPLFMNDLTTELAQAKAEMAEQGIEIQLTDLQLDTTEEDGDTIVRIRGYEVTGSGPDFTYVTRYSPTRIETSISSAVDQIDYVNVITPRSYELDVSGDGDTFGVDLIGDQPGRSWTLDGDISGELLSAALDIDPTCSPFRYDFGGDWVGDGCLNEGLPQGAIDWLNTVELPTEFPTMPIVVTESNGEWYISPIGTVMKNVVTALGWLEDDSIDSWIADLSDLQDVDVTSELEDAFGDIGLDEGPIDGVIGDGGVDDPFTSTDDGAFTFPERETIDRTTSVAVGETVVEAGAVDRGVIDRWAVELPEGVAVAVTVNATDDAMDPALDVLDSDEFFITSNDDFEGLNSAVRFETTSAGVVYLEVREVFDNGGTYEMTVQVADSTEQLTVADGADDAFGFDSGFEETTVQDQQLVNVGTAPLVIGESLDQNTFDVYDFETRGGTLIVEMIPTEDSFLDPVIQVVDDLDQILAYNDDDSSDAGLPFLSSRVEIELPPGSYRIEARSVGDFGEGDYEISMTLN